MTFNQNQNKPGGRLIIKDEIVPPEFTKHLRESIRNGVYRRWIENGGNLEGFFKRWKSSDLHNYDKQRDDALLDEYYNAGARDLMNGV